MAQDPAYQPQPDPKDANKRGTDAEKGAPSSRAPDQSRDVNLDDEKAAKALEKIEEVRRKLEPRG